MPYGPVERPSLDLGILKQALVDDGISCEVLYSTFRFADRIGLVPYTELAWVREGNIGEWTFLGATFPEFQPDHEPYTERVCQLSPATPRRRKLHVASSCGRARWPPSSLQK